MRYILHCSWVDDRSVLGMRSRGYLDARIISTTEDGPRTRRPPKKDMVVKRENSSGSGSAHDGMNSVSWPVQFNLSARPSSGFPLLPGFRMSLTWKTSVSLMVFTGFLRSSVEQVSLFQGSLPLLNSLSLAVMLTVNSLMFMLEVQPEWYHIRPFDSLGWHVGFWNFVGALGFTLCGAFGIAQAQPWALYQSGCSTFWGGWAFLIGSICQWIECLNR